MTQVTGSNVESVAESEVMRILILMRNFIEGYKQASISTHLRTACLSAHRTYTSFGPSTRVPLHSSFRCFRQPAALACRPMRAALPCSSGCHKPCTPLGYARTL